MTKVIKCNCHTGSTKEQPQGVKDQEEMYGPGMRVANLTTKGVKEGGDVYRCTCCSATTTVAKDK